MSKFQSKAKILLSQRKIASPIAGCNFCDICGCTKAIAEEELTDATNLPIELIDEICHMVNDRFHVSSCSNHSKQYKYSEFIVHSCPLCKLNACESCWLHCKNCNLQICIDCNELECGCKDAHHCCQCDFGICHGCSAKLPPCASFHCDYCQTVTCHRCVCDCDK